MTVLLDEAIQDLADRYQSATHLEEPALHSVDQETWEEICEYRRLLDQIDYQNCVEELAQIKQNEQGRNTNH